MNVTKVKGHAKEHDVEGNEDLIMKKIGNDHADSAADKSVEAHVEGYIDIAKYLEKRHKGYCKLVAGVQEMILAVMKENSELRDLAEKEKNLFQSKG